MLNMTNGKCQVYMHILFLNTLRDFSLLIFYFIIHYIEFYSNRTFTNRKFSSVRTENLGVIV